MQPRLTFSEGVRLGLQNIFSFSGRARRSEYWWFYLFVALIELAIAVIIAIMVIGGGAEELPDSLATILGIIFWIPLLGVSVRRLHDTGKSGWWMLLAITSLTSIVLLIFFCMDSQEEANEYGPSPKYGMG